MSDNGLSHKVSQAVRPAIYARVSSRQQAEANTIASQRAALEARVRSDGLELEDELCFVDEGYSGGTLLRPALERMRDQAAAGSFDRLYVHSPDRLARKYPYQVLLVEELQRHGVELVFLNHDVGRTPEENLLLQVQGMMAEYERAKILERSRRGKRHAAKGGSVSVLSGAPYGYRYVGKYEGGGQARYEVDEAQAEIVRQIFSWVALERCSIGEVCRRLKSQGIASPRGKCYWDRTTVWGILKNPAYTGQAHFGKTRVGVVRPRLRPQRGKPTQPRRPVAVYDTPAEEQIGIGVPAIVDEALFAAVAEQLTENRQRRRQRQRGQRYLLQGLLVCGQCGYAYYGKPLSRSASKGKPRHYAYYRCVGSDAYRFGGARVCGNKQCRTDLLDKLVWEDVGALLADPQRVYQEYQRRLQGRRKKTGRPVEQLQRLLAQVRRGITRLLDAYQDGYVEREEFEPRMRSAKERLAKLETEAHAAAARTAEDRDLQRVVEQLKLFAERVREGIHGADWNTRREILRTLIKQVEVGTEAIRVVYKVAPLPFDQGPSRGRSQDCWRGEWSALRRAPALVLVAGCPMLPATLIDLFYRRFQPGLDEPQQTPVADATSHRFHEFGVRDAVEVAAQVRVHHLRMPRFQKHQDLLHSIQGVLLRSVGVLLWLQVGLADRLQDHEHCHLHHPILDRRDAQRPLFAVRLGDEYPPHGLRTIRLLAEFFRQFVHPAFPAVRLDVIERLAIHPGRSLVCKAATVGETQHVATIHLVVQCVEPIGGRTLRFGMQRLPQLPNLVWRY
jgi:site-specific DNA recombinase